METVQSFLAAVQTANAAQEAFKAAELERVRESEALGEKLGRFKVGDHVGGFRARGYRNPKKIRFQFDITRVYAGVAPGGQGIVVIYSGHNGQGRQHIVDRFDLNGEVVQLAETWSV